MVAHTAKLYRMVTPQHICPFGIKSKDLLQRNGFDVEDHLLRSREAADAFKKDHNVKTTPQTFINEERVGGYDDLRSYFKMSPAKKEGKTYTPVIVIFLTSLLVAAALCWRMEISFFSIELIMFFIAITMTVLAIQKLQDLYSFTNQFITYDLLSMRLVPYAYVYPFAEAWVGIGMLANVSAWLTAPIGLFIGTIGAISVFKAVYIDRRQLKCACVGGNSNVPLGFVSLTENLFMIIAAIWMLLRR